MSLSPALLNAFAPRGHLRASINLGNPILAGRNMVTGHAFGVSVDLARAFAARLGLELELIVWDAASKSVEAVEAQQADFGFFAIDPKRGEKIAFTDAYVLIEGSYLVAADSPLQNNDEVDRAGHQVTVGKGSAYDLYLSRELQNAVIERALTSPTVVEHFLAHSHDVAAGVRQQLEADAARFGGLRLLPGRFMVIRQAIGMPLSRGEEAHRFLGAFVEEIKASGFVEQALVRHAIQGASVAPLSNVIHSPLER